VRCQGEDGGKPLVPDVEFWRGFNEEIASIGDGLTRTSESGGEGRFDPHLECWADLARKLIRVGFNRESDQAKGVKKDTSAFMGFGRQTGASILCQLATWGTCTS